MYKVNEPLRVAKMKDNYYVYISRIFNTISVNENVLEFITYLRQQESFSIDVINAFTSENNITNPDDYMKLFDYLKTKGLIV